MSRKPKKPEPAPRPYCGICKGKRYVPGPPEQRFGRVYDLFGNNVPCVCVKGESKPDAQQRAAGEGGA